MAMIARKDKLTSRSWSATGTNTDVGHRAVESVRRGLHPRRHLRCRQQHDGGDRQRHRPEQTDAAAHGLSRLIVLSLTDLLSQQHRHAHGKAGDDHGDSVHHLAAGGDSGDVRRRAELPHYLQVDGAVHGLEQQCQQHRQGKAQQGR